MLSDMMLITPLFFKDIAMQQRLSIITLGVHDLIKARHFYEKGLQWKAAKASNENIVFFQLNGIVLALYPWEKLAEDTTLSSVNNTNEVVFRGMTLAFNVSDKQAVLDILSQAEQAGGKIIKPAQDVFWGGYSGYFSDIGGYFREVAYDLFCHSNEKGVYILD